jgi:hypothetical protein
MRDRSPIHGAAGVVVSIGVTLAACTAGSGDSSVPATSVHPSSTADESRQSEPPRTPSAECVNPPPDLLALINQTDPVPCYGDSPITVEAEVVDVGAIDCPPIEPAWLGCGAWVALQPIAATAATTGIVLAKTSGPPGLPQLFAAIHPETALGADQIMGRPLRITGHYDDPAAQTCHQTGPVFGEVTPPPPEQVIPGCQRMFVMTAFEQL